MDGSRHGADGGLDGGGGALPVDPDLPVEPPPGTRSPGVGWASAATVFVGGVAGTVARYAVGQLLHPWGGVWPAATFGVNVAGAFVLGVLLEGLARRGPDAGGRRRLRLLVGTGFLGAFTTYSALAVETDGLVRDGHAGVAVAYAVGSVLLGLLAAWAGIRVAARSGSAS